MSQMFSKAQPTYEAPPVQPPAPMPDSDSAQVREARRRAQADIMARAGRSSTILTAPDSRGGSGGDTYSGGKLG